MTTRSSVTLVLGFLGALTLGHAEVEAGTCGPNSVLPDWLIPENPIFEYGCAVHDACLDGGNCGEASTVGECASIRDDLFYQACDFHFEDVVMRWACYSVAYMFSDMSDDLTCATLQGCFSSSKVKACTGDELLYE